MKCPILRIALTEADGPMRRFHLTYAAEGEVARATVEIPPLLSVEDQESIRWYLEDYRRFPFEPARTIARHTSARLQDFSQKLFESLFLAKEEARDLWDMAESCLSETRFEIECPSSRINLPWEGIWNPLDVKPLICRAASFVRTVKALPHHYAKPSSDILRVLIVISRPAGRLDVPFRSVAARILDRVGDGARIHFEVLRPPTFAALLVKVRSAADQGYPYTILHFDGHGVHEDRMAAIEGRPARKRKGYLLFEDSTHPDRSDYVDSSKIFRALSTGQIPVLVLNACRSAKAETWDESMGNRRPLGSLAEELLYAGQPAVLAMQYNVEVGTAAQFVADLYEGLARGQALADAVQVGRGHLFDGIGRQRGGDDREVQDWIVPVLFEAFPIGSLLSSSAGGDLQNAPASPPPDEPNQRLVGCDDTLMAIERAFQETSVVVLTGQRGSGKTELAKEFLAWSTRTTEGEAGSIMVSLAGESLLVPLITARREACPDMDTDVDEETSIASWLAEGRGLCVLDDVGKSDPVEWDVLERLVNAAAACRRVLLVTLAPELSMAVASTKVAIGPLDASECLTLVRATLPESIEIDLESWRRIVAFSQGNPLVIKLICTFILKEKYIDHNYILDYARSVPIGLDGVTSHAILRTIFREEEWDRIALLALFEGPVSARMLAMLSSAGSSSASLDETAAPLLNRLSDQGFATPMESEYYRIHPGLPGLLRPEFEHRRPGQSGEKVQGILITLVSATCAIIYRHGESGIRFAHDISIQTFVALEPTIWRVLDAARKMARWDDVQNMAGALRQLLKQTGRYREWREMADELWTLAADPATDGPHQGLESVWHLLEIDRIERLMAVHSLAEAAWLQERDLAHARAELARLDPAESDEFAMEVIIPQLTRLGDIRRGQAHKDTAATYGEALWIAQRLGIDREEYRAACRLASLNESEGDLEAASYWLTYAAELCPPHDPPSLARLRVIEGDLAIRRAASGVQSHDETNRDLMVAADNFSKALNLFPVTPSDDRASCLLKLARVLSEQSRSLEESMQHVQSAINWYDSTENVYEGAYCRSVACRILLRARERSRAYWYAKEAARRYASLAPRAEAEFQESNRLANSLDITEETRGGQHESVVR